MSDREHWSCVILPRFWEETRHLSPGAQRFAAHLLTRQHAVPGFIAASAAVLADDLRAEVREVEGWFAELERDLPGFLERDGRAVRLPKAAEKCHRPNQQVVGRWWREWRALPASALKQRHVESLRRCLAQEPTGLVAAAWDATFATISQAVTGEAMGGSTGGPMGGPTHPVPVTADVPALESSERQSATKTSGVSNPRARKVGSAQQVLIAGETGQTAKANDAPVEGWREVLEEWQVRYVAHTGQKPVWKPLQRHLPKAKAVVLELGAAEVIRRIGIRFTAAPAWMDKDGVPPDFGLFWDRINDFALPARPAAPARASPAAAAQEATSKAQRFIALAQQHRDAGGQK